MKKLVVAFAHNHEDSASRIPSIILLRSYTGMGLREAKEFVDAYNATDHPVHFLDAQHVMTMEQFGRLNFNMCNHMPESLQRFCVAKVEFHVSSLVDASGYTEE